MDLEEIKEIGQKYLFQNYGRQNIAFTHGEGPYLYSMDGKKYLDLIAGIAVNALGYAHPDLTKALQEQVGRLIHTSNLYHVKEQAELAQRISTITPPGLDRTLFVNSGAEANEGAMKLAVRYTGKNKIISAFNGFHGRTSASMGATGQTKYQKSFEPLISNAFSYYDYGDVESVKSIITKDTAALLVEPIQGEGGVATAPKEFFKAVRDICTDNGTIMIVDEVQTGMGRTGKWFGIDNFDVVPDIITLAKGLGGGTPIGAVVSTDEISKVMVPGSHGTTFGGNPLVCTAGSAVIDILKRDNVIENVANLGKHWMNDLKTISSTKIKDVRGYGLMIGIEMDSPELAIYVQKYCLDNGVLVNVCHGNVVRLIPPLIINNEQKDLFTKLLKECLL